MEANNVTLLSQYTYLEYVYREKLVISIYVGLSITTGRDRPTLSASLPVIFRFVLFSAAKMT